MNFGIGRIGEKSIKGMEAHFSDRERWALLFSSFHIIEGGIKDLTLSNLSNGVMNSVEDGDMSKFVQHAYNGLINLLNERISNIHIAEKHLNIVFSADVPADVEIVLKLIDIVSHLFIQNIISGVRVRCFAVLSDGKGLVMDEKSKVICDSLNRLREIKQSKENYVLSHIFVLDDKNIKTVYLGDGHDYLWFALSEFVIAMMDNQYDILSKLHGNTGFYSFGVGMIYFDKLYFEAFFRKRIIRRRLNEEKILYGADSYIYDLEPYFSWVHEYLKPSCDDEFQIDTEAFLDQIDKVKERVREKGDFKLGDFQFSMQLLMGEDLELGDISPDKIYSVDDMIYSILYSHILTKEEKEENNLLDMKHLKAKKADIKLLREENSLGSIIKLEEELEQALGHQRKYVTKYMMVTERLSLKTKIEEMLNNELTVINEKSAVLNGRKKRREEFEQEKSWLCRKRSKDRFDIYVNGIELKLLDLQKKRESLQNIADLIDRLDALYDLRNRLNKEKYEIKSRVRSLKSLEVEENSATSLEYVNLVSILSSNILEEYEGAHKGLLQKGVANQINSTVFDEKLSEYDFKQAVREKLHDTVINIENGISENFDMVEYLSGAYNNLNLFDSLDFNHTLEKLKNLEKPFFNAVNDYVTNSHHLQYYAKSEVESQEEEFNKKVKDCYPAAAPVYIKSKSKNKFALISIEVIKNLAYIAKYNYEGQSKLGEYV